MFSATENIINFTRDYMPTRHCSFDFYSLSKKKSVIPIFGVRTTCVQFSSHFSLDVCRKMPFRKIHAFPRNVDFEAPNHLHCVSMVSKSASCFSDSSS